MSMSRKPANAAASGVRAARLHAERLGLPLVLVHVWDRSALTLYAPYLRSVQAENVAMMNEIEESMQEQLSRLVATELEGLEDVEAKVLHDSSPARALADFVEPDDVIVISTHGRTGLSRMLIGSVAEKVVRLAPCPVLTVPARPEPD